VKDSAERHRPGAGATWHAGEAWFTPLRFGLLLGGMIAVIWPEILLGTHTFIARDYGFFGYPLAHYHRESFWRGEIPLWNPYNNCGLPFLAQWNTMTLYPGSLFYLLFPLPWSLGVFCLTHLFWGGLGMYLLARRWTGHPLAGATAGTAFAFNGIVLNSLMWPNNIAALGWMPWVVLVAERGWRRGGRALWGAGVVGAMQMLTGGPEISLLTWTFLLALAAASGREHVAGLGRRLARLAAIVVLVSLFSAGQLLPFLDLLRQSQRDEHFFESAWAMPGTGWANLLVPLFGCLKTSQGRHFQWDQYWTASYYPGIAILALALLAVWKIRRREVAFLAAIVGAGLILALGEHGYLFPLVKKIVPQIGFMRYPIKLVVWASFGLPLLSAFGLRWLLEPPAKLVPGKVPAALCAATVPAVATVGLIVFAFAHPQPQEDWKDTVLSGLSREALLGIGFGLCLVLRNSVLPVLRLLVVAVLASDLLTAVPLLSPTVPRAVLRPDLSPTRPRPEFGTSRAMVTFAAHQKFNTWASTDIAGDFLVKRSALFANANLIDAIPKLDGFYSLYLKHTDTLLSALYFQTNHTEIARLLSFPGQISFVGLYTFLGVSRISTEGADHEWSTRSNYMPLFSTGQRPVWTNEMATLTGLLRPDFDPRRWVYLPQATRPRIGDESAASARLLATRCGANTLEARVEAAQPGLIAVAQSFHPNWRAVVDDRPAVVLRANYAFQAVSVPAGSHVLRLEYVDRQFIAGLAASGLALLAIGAVRGRSGRRPSATMRAGP